MFKKILIYFFSTLIVILLIYAIFIVIIGTKAHQDNTLPSVFGFSYSIVGSDSMKPKMTKGDVVFIRQTSYSELKEEDIVVYYSNQKRIFIVHRLIEKVEDGWIIKGDANQDIDNELVTLENYFGTVIKSGKFFYLGYITLGHRWIFFLIIFILFLTIIINELIGIFKLISLKKKEEQQKQALDQLALNYETRREQMREEILAELKKNGRL